MWVNFYLIINHDIYLISFFYLESLRTSSNVETAVQQFHMADKKDFNKNWLEKYQHRGRWRFHFRSWSRLSWKTSQKHSNFPLAPENVEISFKDLSAISKDYYTTLENNENYKDVKLVSTFHPRIEYVTHFKNLKLYLQLGLKLRKVHRVLKFHQTNFIAPFIEQCTLLRQQAKTKFEQDQYKKVAPIVFMVRQSKMWETTSKLNYTPINHLFKMPSQVTPIKTSAS